MTAPFVDAVLRGRKDEASGMLGIRIPDDWPDEDIRYLEIWHRRMIDEPQHAKWRARVITEIGGVDMIGHAGFHLAPDAGGMVEIGYTIFEAYRARGYATEAARALARFALENGARTLRASVSPSNAPSLAVVRKLGMIQTGVQIDEIDGEELVFERNLKEFLRSSG
jgi:RimJ/RimL family protein N-acetyltransferase